MKMIKGGKKRFLAVALAILFLLWAAPVSALAQAADPPPDGLTADADTPEEEPPEIPAETPPESGESQPPANEENPAEEAPTPGEEPGEESGETAAPLENGISGIVWLDTNGDGIFDEQEEAVPAYPVHLYKADDLTTAAAEAVTDENGAYRFEDLEPAGYVLGIYPEQVAGKDYALPAAGLTGDNCFTAQENTRALTAALEVEEDTLLENIHAGLSAAPVIEPMSAPSGYVVIIGSTIQSVHDTLAEAVDACPSGQSSAIMLTDDDPAMGPAVLIPAGKDISLFSGAATPCVITQTLTERHLIVEGFLTLSDIILDGSSGGGGAAVRTGGVLVMDAAATIQNCAAVDGGGVHVSGGTFGMNADSTIQNCTATGGGGGLYLASGAIGNMSGGLITGNQAAADGGGVCLFQENTIFTFNGGTITGNAATQTGGGVAAAYGAQFIMYAGTVIAGNTAENGGGVSVTNGATFNLLGGVIGTQAQPNIASQSGGGVLVFDNTANRTSSFSMQGGTISYNQAQADGGGVCVTADAVANPPNSEMLAGEITGNTAQGGGGVALLDSVFFIMAGGSITGNTAQILGGGVLAYSNSFLGMQGEQAEISGNNVLATNGVGGGLALFLGSSADIQNGKVDGNTAYDGGGIYLSADSLLLMQDGSISSNSATHDGGGIFTEDYSYIDPADTTRYANIVLGDTVQFSADTSAEETPPPDNYASFSNFNGALLNNDNINYHSPYVLLEVTYRPNNGTGEAAYVQKVKTLAGSGTFIVESNSATGFTPPANAHFTGWNTAENGSGTFYAPGSSVTFTPELTLYAQWEANKADPPANPPANPLQNPPSANPPRRTLKRLAPQTGAEAQHLGQWTALALLSGLTLSLVAAQLYRERARRKKARG